MRLPEGRRRRLHDSGYALRLINKLDDFGAGMVIGRFLDRHLQVFQRPLRFVGLEPMVCKHGECGNATRRSAFVPLCDEGVQMLTLIVQHQFVCDLLRDEMCEGKRRRLVRAPRDQFELLKLHERARQLQSALRREGSFERTQFEGCADHARQLQRQLLQCAQRVDARGNDALDGVGQFHADPIQLRRSAAGAILDAQQAAIAHGHRECFAEIGMTFSL